MCPEYVKVFLSFYDFSIVANFLFENTVKYIIPTAEKRNIEFLNLITLIVTINIFMKYKINQL